MGIVFHSTHTHTHTHMHYSSRRVYDADDDDCTFVATGAK